MLDIRGKFLETMPDGSPKGCRVILGNDEGAVIPILLSEDYQEKSQSETLQAALDKHYEATFPNRAEKEAIQRVLEEISEVRQLQKAADKKAIATEKKVKDLEVQVVNIKSAQTKVQHEVEVEIEE